MRVYGGARRHVAAAAVAVATPVFNKIVAPVVTNTVGVATSVVPVRA